MTEDGGDSRGASDLFREWLRVRMTGCHFASRFASKGKHLAFWTRPYLRSLQDVQALDRAIESNAREGRFMIGLFPHIRTATEIADFLHVLDASDRWSCSHLAWQKHARADAALIRVMWRTEPGPWSSVMGLAPLGTMPVSRRSPFVALALWGGGFENPLRKGTPGVDVGLVDGVHGLEQPAHDELWSATSRDVRSLFSDPPEYAPRLRGVAFVLPRGSVHDLAFKDGTSLDRPATS